MAPIGGLDKGMLHAWNHVGERRTRSRIAPDTKIRKAVISPKFFQRRSKRSAILKPTKIQNANAATVSASEAGIRGPQG